MVNMLKTASLHHLQVWSWVLLEMQSLPIFILYRWQYTSHYTGIISHHNIYHFLLTKYIWPDESLCWGKHLCCAGQSHHKTVEDLGIALRQIYNHWIKMQYCPQRFSGKKINKKKKHPKNSVLQTQLWKQVYSMAQIPRNAWIMANCTAIFSYSPPMILDFDNTSR